MPLIAVGFWLGSTWLNHRVMGRTYQPASQLTAQSSPAITLSLSLNVASIDAEIDQGLGTAEVTIQTIGSALQELEFEYPFTDYEQIEAAIAQELNLAPDIIRRMIRYRITP